MNEYCGNPVPKYCWPPWPTNTRHNTVQWQCRVPDCGSLTYFELGDLPGGSSPYLGGAGSRNLTLFQCTGCSCLFANPHQFNRLPEPAIIPEPQ